MTESGTGWLVDYEYLDEVQQGSGVDLAACYQCRKCSNGCPVSFAMDLRPEQIVKLVTLGARKRVEHSSTIWICASCQTCLTRCPNDVDIPRLMDFLKENMVKRGEKSPEPAISIFHKCFLRNMVKRGRIFEAGMMQNFLIRSGKMLSPTEIIKKTKLGLGMLTRGRLALIPRGIKGKKEIKNLFKQTGGLG